LRRKRLRAGFLSVLGGSYALERFVGALVCLLGAGHGRHGSAVECPWRRLAPPTRRSSCQPTCRCRVSAIGKTPYVGRLADCSPCDGGRCSSRMAGLQHGVRGVTETGSDQTESRYAWITTTPHPVVITDAQGRVLAQSAAFGRLFSVSDSGLAGGSVEDVIITSRYRAAYRAARRRALADGPAVATGPVSEFVAVRADGGEFPVNLGLAARSEDPTHVATWIRDLADDRMTMTHTPSRETLYERAEELSGFGSWEWTSDRILWSDNLFRIYGLRPGEITPSAEYVSAHCHPDDQERLERAEHELGRTGQRRDLRYRFVRPDGTVRHLTSTVVSVVNSGGWSRTLTGTVHDVTDHHQAERELAARFAVSDALSDWQPGPLGARRLVRDLAEALEFDFGVMLIPRDDVLVAWVIWQARASRSPQRESEVSEVRLARGDGLAGSAWISGLPTRIADLTDDASDTVRAIDARTGMYGSLAVPATYGDEVLAVLTFASRHQAALTDQFMRSLLGIGYEIGHFLARRRSELSAPPLSVRELQVLQLSATGYARRQIAEELLVSEATVKTHFEHIYRKLGVPDRASAIAEALRHGLIQ
jgi:PAS domain S-box-containing protein